MLSGKFGFRQSNLPSRKAYLGNFGLFYSHTKSSVALFRPFSGIWDLGDPNK